MGIQWRTLEGISRRMQIIDIEELGTCTDSSNVYSWKSAGLDLLV